ncbi:alpha/beta hydrolase [Nonomuraea sp. NPDC049400]|uniref:alpha/beta hydrolase n=1 Tax=Nonomuraea sp. NPDC049400 TaxID=3364352 RepID=UPI003796EA0D
MPSRTYDVLLAMFRELRENGKDVTLDEERVGAEVVGDLYRDVPGITDQVHPFGRLLSPPEPRDDLAILFIHGGGFRTGTARNGRQAGAHLAASTGARVLLPDYRLAPEHPYPAALDDCEAAYLDTLGRWPEARIVVGGESAGANLATALLLRRRDAADTRAAAGFVYCGVFDLRPENYARGSWQANAETDLIIKPSSGPVMTSDYLAGHPPADRYASPALADLAGLPPLFIQVSGAELLLDDSLALATRAARAGVEVELEVWPHMQHVWHLATGFLPEATEAVDRTVAFIQRVAEGRVVDGAALSGGPASFEEVT